MKARSHKERTEETMQTIAIAHSRGGSRHSGVAVRNIVPNHFVQLRGRHRINPTPSMLLPDERGVE